MISRLLNNNDNISINSTIPIDVLVSRYGSSAFLKLSNLSSCEGIFISTSRFSLSKIAESISVFLSFLLISIFLKERFLRWSIIDRATSPIAMKNFSRIGITCLEGFCLKLFQDPCNTVLKLHSRHPLIEYSD